MLSTDLKIAIIDLVVNPIVTKHINFDNLLKWQTRDYNKLNEVNIIFK